MTDPSSTPQDDLQREIRDLHAGLRSAVLATVGVGGVPLASYAPYITDEAGNFYVFVSGLSLHTRDLLDTERVSLLFIEDEGVAGNLFARRRLTYACTAAPIPREAPEWGGLIDRFAARFGNIIDTLRALADFQLFRLTPSAGSYVRGFGQAFALTGPGLAAVEHVNPARPAPRPAEAHSAGEVLEFWFSERVRPRWFDATPELDREVGERFLDTWRTAVAGELSAWMQTPEGALALVIVLDQFPLNMFRGRPESFATEAAAREAAAEAIARGYDLSLPDERKAFLYLPFMHSENLADQDRAVALYERAGLEDSLKWARHHREIVRRFGRFPHRNAILGRPSTPEEIEYLSSEGAFKG